MSSTVQTMTGKLVRLLWVATHPRRAHRAYIRAIEHTAIELGRDWERCQWVGPQPPPHPGDTWRWSSPSFTRVSDTAPLGTRLWGLPVGTSAEVDFEIWVDSSDCSGWHSSLC